MKKLLFAFLSILASQLAFGYSYVVEENDVLSTIAKKLSDGRIYGKNGNLKRILSANSWIRNPNKLKPGMTILIPFSVKDLSTEPFSPAPIDKPPQPVTQIPLLFKEDLDQPFQLQIWLEGSLNYISYSQETASKTESGQFSSLGNIGISGGASGTLSDLASLRFGYQKIPGNIETGSDVVINSRKLEWKIMSADLIYRVFDWQKNHLSVLVGGQLHQVPFLSDSGTGDVKIINNEFKTISGGFLLQHFFNSKYEYQGSFRYQSLISSSSQDDLTFKAHNRLVFDTNIGMIRKYDNGLNFGIFWVMNYVNLSYDSVAANGPESGNIRLVNSSFNLRTSYQF